MTTYLEKALNLRRHEFLPASILFGYLFLSLATYIMGLSVGTAMFLSAYPDNLPHVMVATAVVVAAYTSIYIRLSGRMRLEWLIIGSLGFFALSFGLFWWMTLLGFKSVYWLIYIWVALQGAMGPMMGWTLANLVLTTREARRVFGFIGAGAVLGAPVSGFFTAFATRHVHPELLLLLMVAMLAACAVLVRVLFAKSRERLAELSRRPASPADIPKNFRDIWAHIRGSHFLILITALTAIGCTSTTIIGYQFSIIAKDAIPVKAQLASFFALFSGVMGAAAFLVQMLLTGRLLRVLGIRVTLFVTPVVFLMGSVGLLFAPFLITACILKGSHLLLRFTVDKSTAELLYLPVTPPDIKSQLKPFIDGFVWRAADGVAGLTLWVFATFLHFTPAQMSLVNVFYLSAWIAIAWGVRREYLNVLRQAIQRRTLDADKIATGVLDSTTTEVMAMSFEQAGEQQVLYGLSLFEVGHQAESHPALRRLLEHPSPAVRQRALRLLSDAGDRKLQPQAEKMLGDESNEVRAEALRYLVTHTGKDPLTLLSTETSLPEHVVQGSVVVYLARTEVPEDLAAAQLILESMLAQTDLASEEGNAGDHAGRNARAEAARALGAIPADSPLQSELPRLLRDEDPAVEEQALLAAGKTRNRDVLPLIIEKLADPHLLGAARTALVEYGDRAVGTLQDYLNDESGNLAVRKQIPAVLARYRTPKAAGILSSSMIHSDAGLRFDVLKAMNRLRKDDPALLPPNEEVSDMLEAEAMGYYRSMQILAAFDPAYLESATGQTDSGEESIVARALRERMDHELERIFRLLALLYPPRDIHNSYAGLTSGQARIQANALEVLEHVLRPEHFRLLSSALDPDIHLKEKLHFAERLCHSGVNSRLEALRILLHSEDRWLRACALHAIGELRLADLSAELRRVALRGDALLEETWNWAAARLGTASA
ncbi:MAG TPA: MFS transporter [Terriglobia bacterium]|nr:MFS transporter [Terriglobia bacterium]